MWKQGVEPTIGTVYRLAEQLEVDPAVLIGHRDHQRNLSPAGGGDGKEYIMAKDSSQLYPSVTASSKVMQVICTVTRVGKGTEDDPFQFLTQYWSLDGELLAEHDPEAKTESSGGDAPPKGDAKSLPFGWDTGLGARGPVASDMLVDHLIYWLKKCQINGERDPAGNVYFGVDAFIIRQTVGLLKEHRDYLTYRTREKAEDARRRQVGPAWGEQGDCQGCCLEGPKGEVGFAGPEGPRGPGEEKSDG